MFSKNKTFVDKNVVCIDAEVKKLHIKNIPF